MFIVMVGACWSLHISGVQRDKAKLPGSSFSGLTLTLSMKASKRGLLVALLFFFRFFASTLCLLRLAVSLKYTSRPALASEFLLNV